MRVSGTEEVVSEKDAAMQREHWWNHGRYGRKPRIEESWESPQGNGGCRDKAGTWKGSQGRLWGVEAGDLESLCVSRTSGLGEMVVGVPQDGQDMCGPGPHSV